MRRAFFLAAGICLLIFGLECLIMDHVILSTRGFGEAGAIPAMQEFSPPDWCAWTFLTMGAIVILWTFSIPKRVSG